MPATACCCQRTVLPAGPCCVLDYPSSTMIIIADHSSTMIYDIIVANYDPQNAWPVGRLWTQNFPKFGIDWSTRSTFPQGVDSFCNVLLCSPGEPRIFSCYVVVYAALSVFLLSHETYETGVVACPEPEPEPFQASRPASEEDRPRGRNTRFCKVKFARIVTVSSSPTLRCPF